jgi:uncharacterized protein
MNLEELRQHKPEILRITESYGISNVRVFGSVARGEERPESDIDLLVHVPNTISLLRFAGLQNRLSEALETRVDIVPEGGISPYLREQILREAVQL